MKILLIGGTRFFGKHIVNNLLSQNFEVTILNRGNHKDDFGNRVNRIIADRRDYNQMQNAMLNAKFDVVIDQFCYTPIDAEISTKVFAGRTDRYIMTSTIETYNKSSFKLTKLPFISGSAVEEELDLFNYPSDYNLPWDDNDFLENNYAEGKRQAESVLFSKKTFPVVTVRLSHVLSGHDDFTGRLPSLIDKINNGEHICIHPNPQKTSFITRDEAAKFFIWLLNYKFEGAINAAAFESLSIKELCSEIGKHLNKTPQFISSSGEDKYVSYSYEHEFSMSIDKAKHGGFKAESLHEGLKKIISNY